MFFSGNWNCKDKNLFYVEIESVRNISQLKFDKFEEKKKQKQDSKRYVYRWMYFISDV